ncbi:hypothetical protein [Microbacterium sp. TWP3-1-2b2]|uniref:hypothetical protein n=1 Tax=Microbacterium sp. TWP3-1-2b2 TaxID=2804651 RepID=UPI003CE8048B
MTEQDGICIVCPPAGGNPTDRITPEQQRWVDDVRKSANDRDLEVKIFRTVVRRSNVKGQKERRFNLLDPWEADRLYRLVHRGFDAVFQAGSARVLLNPIKALETSNSVPLSQVVRHKSFFAQLDGITPAADTFAAFDAWSEVAHCDSHRDCRVLPLHMFSPRRDWEALTTTAERKLFERAHGIPTRLVDEKARRWNQTTAWHGNDSLAVAKYGLPTGFHWDVTGVHNTSRLSSLTSTWQFKGEAYLNVSPDGFIRAGQSKGITAMMEGEAPRPAPSAPNKPSKRERNRARRERQLAKRH